MAFTIPDYIVRAGKVLRSAREKSNVSRYDIAGAERTMVGRMETGERWASRETMKAVLDALNLPPEDYTLFMVAFGYATEHMSNVAIAYLESKYGPPTHKKIPPKGT